MANVDPQVELALECSKLERERLDKRVDRRKNVVSDMAMAPASMADGSDTSAPASLSQDPSFGDEVKSVDGARHHCTACGNAVKGHVGPHGKAKCIYGIVEKLSKRVATLETELQESKKAHDELARLSEERQTGLLKTIDALQEEVEALQSKVDSKERNNLDRSPRPSSPVEDSLPSKVQQGTHTHNSVHVREEKSVSPRKVHGTAVREERSEPIEKITPDNSAEPAPEKSPADEGNIWVTHQRRRRTAPERSLDLPKSALRGGGTLRSNGLHGASRVACSALHLSHISPESNVEDVLQHCRERRVNVAGCFFIRTRIWGTQSAKILVADCSVAEVLKDGFWPEKIECRRWESTPPRRQRVNSASSNQ